MARYKLILRILFRVELLLYRKSGGNTQEEMAEKLHISVRSYMDLEHGRYCVSSVTLLFFLGTLPDEKKIELIRSFVLHAKEADEHVQIA